MTTVEWERKITRYMVMTVVLYSCSRASIFLGCWIWARSPDPFFDCVILPGYHSSISLRPTKNDAKETEEGDNEMSEGGALSWRGNDADGQQDREMRWSERRGEGGASPPTITGDGPHYVGGNRPGRGRNGSLESSETRLQVPGC